MDTIYTRHLEVVRVESKRHQAKEGKLCTAYTADFNRRDDFFTERFDF